MVITDGAGREVEVVTSSLEPELLAAQVLATVQQLATLPNLQLQRFTHPSNQPASRTARQQGAVQPKGGNRQLDDVWAQCVGNNQPKIESKVSPFILVLSTLRSALFLSSLKKFSPLSSGRPLSTSTGRSRQPRRLLLPRLAGV